MKTYQPRGFSFVELMLIIVVLGVIAFLGVVGYDRWQENMAKTDTTTQTENTASTPTITSTEDLDTAINSLDKTDVAADDEADESELDDFATTF